MLSIFYEPEKLTVLKLNRAIQMVGVDNPKNVAKIKLYVAEKRSVNLMNRKDNLNEMILH